MLNPFMYKVEGDLSKADVVVLTQLCRNKTVVEFGIGGSTILLSQVAKKIISYEHDQAWIDKIQPKVGENVEIRLIPKEVSAVKGKGEECDVLFDDGHSLLRAPFLLEFWPYLKECAILHDSRMTYAGNCVKLFFDAFTVRNPKVGEPGFDSKGANPGLPDNPYTGSLKTIYWNYLESNMVVMEKRNCTLKYENWKISEGV